MKRILIILMLLSSISGFSQADKFFSSIPEMATVLDTQQILTSNSGVWNKFTAATLRNTIGAKVTASAIGYVPTLTGNTLNLNEFVTDTAGDVWFIDVDGEAVKLKLDKIGFSDFDTDVSATMEFAVGAYLDSPDVTVTSNGATVLLNMEKEGGGDIRVIFSTGVYVYDATPIASIALTAGTDISPTNNFIYILESTKLLTVSTSGWPVAEFSAVATVLCQSAASVQTIGAYKVHVWTDHMSNGNGHLFHINKWIRWQPATWLSGVDWTLNINTTPAPDDMYFTSTAGTVSQLHTHTFPAFTDTTTFDYLFVNHPTAYTKANSIGEILVDATGGSLSGRFYTYVIWGVVSEDTGDSHLMINLPTGSYGTSSAALADTDGFTVYDTHSDYTGTSFLIAEITAQHASGGGGTFTSIRETDLRGKSPGAVSGGGGTATTNFQDDQFTIYDNVDPTKILSIEAGGISTGTTRTLTVPDASGTISIDGHAHTMQSTYDASSSPEILTDVIRGAMSIRRGSSLDTDNVLDIQNGAGTEVFAVTGEGNVSVAGTVDGRDILLDGTKLDGIPSNATPPQPLSSVLFTGDGGGFEIQNIANGTLSNSAATKAQFESADNVLLVQIDALTAAQTGGLKSFTTLILLEAYATPDINDSYKVTNDGANNGYYHWVSGTNYVKDASLYLGEVVDGDVDAVEGGKIYNITSEKADLVIGKNIFDKSLITNLFRITSAGLVQSFSTYSHSDFIPVVAGDYTANPVIRYACFYDVNKVVVAGGFDATDTNTFTVPGGVAFVIISYLSIHTDDVQLELGSTITFREDYNKSVTSEQTRYPVGVVEVDNSYPVRGGDIYDAIGLTSDDIIANMNAILWTRILGIQDITIPNPPDILLDGNTVAWYDLLDLTKIETDAFNRVSKWKDKLSGGNDLINTTANDTKPILAKYGVQFDGVKSTLRTPTFTFVQPEMIYLVVKSTSWANFDVVFGGEGRVVELTQRLAPYGLSFSENSKHIESLGFENREVGIIRMLADNLNSFMTLNDSVPLPRLNNFQAGTTMNGITLGSSTTPSDFANVEIMEVIFRKVKDSATDEQAIYDYLEQKYTVQIPDTINSFDNAKFALTFDDARESVYTVAFPLMTTKGIVSTIYVNGGTVGDANRMTWAQIIEMEAAGHDMQCHTFTHNDNMNTQEEVNSEFTQNDSIFVLNGLPRPVHFAYPSGAITDDRINFIINSGLRLSARMTANRFTNGFTNKSTYKWNFGTNLTDSTPQIDIESIIDQSLVDNSAITTYIHEIGVVPSSLQMDVVIFEAMIDYALAAGLDFITISELYALMD